MKSLFLGPILLAFCANSLIAQPIYMAQNGFISFFSAAKLENIDGKNNAVKGILNSTSREIHLVAPIRQFKFDKELMTEHFNENYLESDKFPTANYDGKINEELDFSKDGTYDATTTGKLKIHGVEKDITEKGKVIVQGSSIKIQCTMNIKVADYNIEIPKLVFENIAETVEVKMDIVFTPYKKAEK